MQNFIDVIKSLSYHDANAKIEDLCGIVRCFTSDQDKHSFLSSLNLSPDCVCESRVTYGDWQTPDDLSKIVCAEHLSRYGCPDIMIEPTCGLGSFVLAALEIFPNLAEIHAIEIKELYINELKKAIILRALAQERKQYPKIFLYVDDVFKFNFHEIADRLKSTNLKVALIGNPPWVTNSKQGQLDSRNIPLKYNLYQFKGIDAITGKSNFDISEYIVLLLIQTFQYCLGGISILLKNSVIRNIVEKQHFHPNLIDNIFQLGIDAAKEFNVAVEASCFTARLNQAPSFTCCLGDIYTKIEGAKFGWVNDSFVSDVKSYIKYQIYDGISKYTWRSGIKHDCTPILELTLNNTQYYNGLGELVDIEEDLIFPYLKSSDVQKYDVGLCNGIKKFIIVTQHFVGESTSFIASKYPKTYSYLISHIDFFAKRKSLIYRNKDKFSVFGIGDYTFSPYKIVVSSLYKTICFKVLTPYKDKPIVVDDTCYQLAFDSEADASIVYNALISDEIQSLLQTLIFMDAKRVVTKALLMRLDISKYLYNHGVLSQKVEENPNNRQLSLFDGLE
ncbi:MAG: SAM-dependent methyltransferase [Muribaculum sp.]|nr:SAM-dependent methyltransferase [Muribaculum sp.]